jgi:hypothetical protein
VFIACGVALVFCIRGMSRLAWHGARFLRSVYRIHQVTKGRVYYGSLTAGEMLRGLQANIKSRVCRWICNN